MRKIKKLIVPMFIIGILLFSCIPSASAWSSHGLALSYVLQNENWLDEYDNITITEYSYEDVDTEPYSPDFVIRYLEGSIGEKTTAKKILTTYADEPDWNMDTNLELSKLQILTGGSQGYRHQYYGLGFLRIGAGPKRAQYWLDLAKIANERGDLYWTFRFLARGIHHIEDLTCPYHGVPAPIGIIFSKIIKIGELTTIASNHHYNMEEFQGQQINHTNPEWLSVLNEAEPLDLNKVRSVTWLGQYAASISKNNVRSLWTIENELFGEKISNPEEWLYTEDPTFSFEGKEDVVERYNEEILKSFTNFATFSRTFLQYARINIGL